MEAHHDPQRQADHNRYFKEDIESYGLAMPTVKQIARRYYKELKVYKSR